MRPIRQADSAEFRGVRFVLTDMDDTLTYQGRLQAETYGALERLQEAGVKVIPVTAAPAGWCDQMARMWPVDGVIGENGGFFFQRSAQGHGLDDAPMFAFFRHSVGVSTVTRYLDEIPEPPTWITQGPGGSGFVEAADAVILSRRS
jgi:hydroxymethylpyrimidine pyrophosphatase-like HAD family hydrolase